MMILSRLKCIIDFNKTSHYRLAYNFVEIWFVFVVLPKDPFELLGLILSSTPFAVLML